MTIALGQVRRGGDELLHRSESRSRPKILDAHLPSDVKILRSAGPGAAPKDLVRRRMKLEGRNPEPLPTVAAGLPQELQVHCPEDLGTRSGQPFDASARLIARTSDSSTPCDNSLATTPEGIDGVPWTPF